MRSAMRNAPMGTQGVTRGGWRLPVAALALACAGLPAVAGPSACWTPESAPGLFDWSATPGIACRDESATPHPGQPIPVAAATSADRHVAPGPGTSPQITFSGSAYMGIAVAF